MNVERLVDMVNDIANFFASEPDHASGVAGVAIGDGAAGREPARASPWLAASDESTVT